MEIEIFDFVDIYYKFNSELETKWKLGGHSESYKISHPSKMPICVHLVTERASHSLGAQKINSNDLVNGYFWDSIYLIH